MPERSVFTPVEGVYAPVSLGLSLKPALNGGNNVKVRAVEAGCFVLIRPFGGCKYHVPRGTLRVGKLMLQ